MSDGARSTPPALRVEKLEKSFGGMRVACGISLDLPRGSRVALIGPNGAGKTTFVNLVTGRIKPDSGRVSIDGVDVTRLGKEERTRRGLVRSFQISRLFQDFSFRDHLRLAILQRDGCTGRMFTRIDRSPAREAEVAAVLEQLELTALADTKVRDAAYGQHRLLEIAIALAMKSKVLLLDEPAAGVSRGDIPKILGAIERLPAEMAVLMIEHDLDFAFRFASHVVVLAAGAIIFEGSPDAVVLDPQVRRAYLGNYVARSAATASTSAPSGHDASPVSGATTSVHVGANA